MSGDVNNAEFESVLALSAPRRYEYFIKRSAGHGELWGLHGDGGWVMAEDDDGRTLFPFGRIHGSQRHVRRKRGRTERPRRSTSTNGWRRGSRSSPTRDSESRFSRRPAIEASPSRPTGSNAISKTSCPSSTSERHQ
jgi:hypothetical protein